MLRKYDIVVAGHICLDITPSFGSELGSDPAVVFAPGRLLKVGKPVISTGGAVSNTGVAMLRMGFNTQLMAKVGDDYFGKLIYEICEAEGAAGGLLVVQGELSSYSCVIAVPGIDRIFFHCPGCNDTFVADDVDYNLVSQARMFHFGYPPLMEKFYADSGEQLSSMFRRVKEQGTITSLDLSYPDITSPAGQADWQKIFAASLGYVDIFLPSIEEILLLLDREVFVKYKQEAGNQDMTEFIPVEVIRQMGNKLLSLGVKIAVIKCGSRGLYLRSATEDMLMEIAEISGIDASLWAGRELWQPPFKVKVVNAAGSGDSAIAAFLAAVLAAKSPEDALGLGCAAGALAVQNTASGSEVKSFAEIEAYFRGLQEKLPLALPVDWKIKQGSCYCGPDDSYPLCQNL